MKPEYIKGNWLVPLVGMVVVAAALVAGRVCLNCEQRTNAGLVLTAMLDRVYEDQQLCLALKSLQDGDAAAAAKRLDRLLCEHIIRLDADAASADDRTRRFVNDAFQRLALVRPNVGAASATGPTANQNDDQIAAGRILSRALVTNHAALVN